MPFRRRSAKKLAKPARSFGPAVERLESRQLLTAVINGLFQGTGTGFDGLPFFEYEQPTGDRIRISISGNVTAEFIGATTTTGLTLTDLSTDEETPTYLFGIYVVKSDINCIISIAGLSSEPVPRMDPLGGNVNMDYFDLTGEDGQASLTGAAFLGALTEGETAFAIINSPDRVFGMRPRSAGELFSGLEVAPGNDLGAFFFGGTVTGLVDIPGNIVQFYANSVLTGVASGLGENESSNIHRNFYIGGDAQNIMAGESFGTLDLSGQDSPTDYPLNTGFEAYIGGRVGQIRAADSFLGSVVVRNSDTISGPGTAQEEVEVRGNGLGAGLSYFDPQFGPGVVGIGAAAPETIFNNNDSFDAAQFLGTLRSRELGSREVIQLKGSIGNNGLGGDLVDYYALPLLAGQTVEVQLEDLYGDIDTTDHLRLGIFDPENRLIISDYSNIKEGTRIGDKLRFTAEKPGAYRIAVGNFGDANFSGAIDGVENFLSATPQNSYELRVTGVADIALGGLIAETHIGTPFFGYTGVQVLRGDLGEVRAGTLGEGTIFSSSLPWYIPAGNLRAMEALAIGNYTIAGTSTGNSGPDFLIRKGSVGLLRATGANNAVVVNDDVGQVASLTDTAFGPLAIYPQATSNLALTPKTLAIGGTYQWIDSAGSVGGILLANGGIGVIRAASVGDVPAPAPVWQVNVDKAGDDGIIDLIDVAGNFFAPAITTGPNGNVRYMHLTGTVQRDPFFGGGVQDPTIFAPGSTATFTDDSGTLIKLTPLPLIGGTVTALADPPQLTVLTYPIRDKAGVVVVSVTVTPFDDGVVPAFLGGGGLRVETGTRGPLSSAEIGLVATSGTGNTMTFDAFNRVYVPTLVPTNPNLVVRDLDLIFTGDSTVDVYEINATGTISNLINETDGEIVNITGAPDIVLMEAETFGLAKTHNKAAIEGVLVRDNTYPFVNQKNLIQVGDLNSLRARRGVGNVLAANINSIVANSDRKNVAGVFEGINGPIVSLGTTEVTGNIVSVSIGEGLASSGSGTVGLSGIFADGRIDAVSGSGVGVDIRGDIVARGSNTVLTQQATDANGALLFNPDGTPLLISTPDWGINSIRLRGGSIVDADLMVIAGTFDQSTEGSRVQTFIDNADDFTEPSYEIVSVRLDGTGGILGAFVVGVDIGDIAVNEGFGILNSEILSFADGVINSVATDGYGIRDTNITGGANLNEVVARGRGKRIGTNWWSPSVRQSGSERFDPATGQSLDALTDLHKFLGTTQASDKIKGISDAGVIEDSQFLGGRNLGKIEAYRIVARNTLTNDGAARPITRGESGYPMRIAFGNSTNKILVAEVIDGLALTTGSLNDLRSGGDMLNSEVNVSGRIKNLSFGALRGTSTVQATGPDGQIDSLVTKRSLYGTVIAAQDIIKLSVGTDLGSPLVNASRNIRQLNVAGSVLTGSFVRARKTIFNLNIGKDVKAGATIKADAIVNQSIGGEVIGDIIIV